VSIGRRLIDLARAELNSLLDRAARAEDDDAFGRAPADALSDEELEAELERRRRAREEAEEAAHGPRARASSASHSTSSSRRNTPPPRRTASGDDALRKAYAALEVPPGSDFETVRKAYRTLMRKYHPDLHAGRPDKQKAANELTQKLTESYKLLEKRLRR
jgi:DnaJ-domain-containing protein 1